MAKDGEKGSKVLVPSASTLTLAKKQITILKKATPKSAIKTRVGRGGGQFSYVPVGYIIDQLNEAFGHVWNFEILDQKVGSDQVWVKGQLTVMMPGGITVKKNQFGGAIIKKHKDELYNSRTRQYYPNPKSGLAVCISDDLKAASSDALKKCASLLGLALDVFAPELEQYTNGDSDSESETEQKPIEGEVVPEVVPNGGEDVEPSEIPDKVDAALVQKKDPYARPVRAVTTRALFAKAREVGLESEEAKQTVKDIYGLKSYNDITETQAQEFIKTLDADIKREKMSSAGKWQEKREEFKKEIADQPVSPTPAKQSGF